MAHKSGSPAYVIGCVKQAIHGLTAAYSDFQERRIVELRHSLPHFGVPNLTIAVLDTYNRGCKDGRRRHGQQLEQREITGEKKLTSFIPYSTIPGQV